MTTAVSGPSTGSRPRRSTAPLLAIRDLEVGTTSGGRPIVTGVSFDVRAAEVVAVVGESGSGKSTVCHAVVGLLAGNLAVRGGSIVFEGDELVGLPPRRQRALRGRRIGMVFQDPLASLNPVRKIGFQLAEARVIHGVERWRAARAWAAKTVEELGFKEVEPTLDAYPHTLSGGMRQRICVGIAFSAEPGLVIADEPTTALDVSLQGRLLRLLLRYAKRFQSAILLVSHDIGVVRAVADRVVVMYGGRVLESGPADQVLNRPRSPYTRALLSSLPNLRPESRGRELVTIEGELSQGALDGCPFAPRCPNALPTCGQTFPAATTVEDHSTWCWNPNSPEDGHG
jgi:oligopeptide/dipeptide ABC transporter ATP-binding protein